MQIRLTVLGSRGGRPRDVLVTAPSGTTLSSVANALAATGPGSRGGRTPSQVTVHAGARRLPADARLGTPPLVDGAVLTLHAPSTPDALEEATSRLWSTPRNSGAIPDTDTDTDAGTETGADTDHDEPQAWVLHVVGGPDAGGVHLLSTGEVRVGRSAEADIPLDDPDVSRTHLLLRVDERGVSVADPGSTNGSTVDGAAVGPDATPAPSGALLQLGESSLVLTDAGTRVPRETRADGDGHLTLLPAGSTTSTHSGATGTPGNPPGGDDGPRASTRTRETQPDDAEQRLPAVQRPPGRLGFSLQRMAAAARARGLFGRTAERRRREKAHRGEQARLVERARRLRDRWPDPSELLLAALGPGPRLWERRPGHPDELCVRLGTADVLTDTDIQAYVDGDTSVLLPAVPITVDLRETGVLGLAGPRRRLAGLARAVVAQLAALHAPQHLNMVVLTRDGPVSAGGEASPSRRSTPRRDEHGAQLPDDTGEMGAAPPDADETAGDDAARDWAWTRWLPHLRPDDGQPCRLLVGTDPDQVRQRLEELVTRLDARKAAHSDAAAPDAAAPHPHTLLVVDLPPTHHSAYERELRQVLTQGPEAGIVTLCLAEHPSELPPGCVMWAELDREVATHLRLRGPQGAAPERISTDAVPEQWAERFARALAALREPTSDDAAGGAEAHANAAGSRELPERVRLLDTLGLDQITPSRLADRWTGLPAVSRSLPVVLGADGAGASTVDLVSEGPHLLLGGAPGSGRTELLRSMVASLAVVDRPDRLGVVLLEGAASDDTAAVSTSGLLSCTDLPHVATFLGADDPLRTRRAARALHAELRRRQELLGEREFHRQPVGSGGLAPVEEEAASPVGLDAPVPARAGQGVPASDAARSAGDRARGSASDAAPDGTARAVLPRLLVVVDNLDALLERAGTGSPRGMAKEAASALARALDDVASQGGRLGIHLVAATARPRLLAATELAEATPLRVALRTEDAVDSRLLIHVEDAAGLDAATAGRGWLRRPDGAVTAFQAGRISGRIPRTATLRPTAVAVDWRQMGSPVERRPVREIGNGPTDLALLASALQRATESRDVDPVPPLFEN